MDRNLVRDFGAVGDFQADDTPAFIKAAGTLAWGDRLIVPSAVVAYRLLVATPYYPTFALARMGVTLVGDGERSLLKLDASSAIGSHILNIDADGIVLEGVAFDPNGVKDALCAKTGSADTDIRYSYFFNPLTGGVYIAGRAAHIRVLRPTVTGVGYGVCTDPASTVSDLTVQQGVFRGAGSGDAIEINTPNGGAINVDVLDNDISGYADSGQHYDGIGIGLAHVTGGSVLRNHVRNCGLDGIHIEDGSCGLLVAENPVEDCKRMGISINSSNPTRQTGGIKLYRNPVWRCKLPGIALEGTQRLGPVERWGNTVDGLPWAA